MEPLGQLIWFGPAKGIHKQLADLSRQVVGIRTRPLAVEQISDISPDLGVVTGGRFIASSDSDPLEITDSDTEGGAPTVSGSGVVIDGDGIPVGDTGDVGHIIGYNGGAATVWISAVDGSEYAASGALVINSDGVAFTGLNYLLDFTATNSGETRTGHFGMVIGPDGSTPALAILFDGESGGSELVTNGGAEDGDLTGWTDSSTFFAVNSSKIHSGSHNFYNDGTSGATETLTGSRMTPISVGSVYAASLWLATRLTATTTLDVYIKWYDATSGGSLIKTDTVLSMASVIGDGAYHQYSSQLIAPSGAQSAEFVFSTKSFNTPYFDDFSFAKVAVSTRQLAFQPDPTINNGGWGYQELTSAPVNPLSGYLLTYGSSKHNARLLNSLGQDDILYKGDVSNYALIATGATTQQTIYSRTIKANCMGSNGGFTVRGAIALGNGAGGGGRSLAPLEFNLGGTTIFTFTPSGTGSTANRFVVYEFILSIRNSGATNSQICTLALLEQGNIASGTGTVALGTVRHGLNATTTIDTTADITFSIYGTPSNTGTTLYREYVEMTGPYYA